MAVSKCWDCRYENSDCKGNKSIDRTECGYFKEKLAINYPARIRELEGFLDQVTRSHNILATEYEKLKSENKKLKAECNKHWCKADCNECDHRCRAWQNGYNHNRPTTEIIGTKALIESYIDRLQNCGLGKRKSLEYVGKFVSCLIFEKESDTE